MKTLKNNKSTEVKRKFVEFFDDYQTEELEDVPSTFEMGVCKLEYKEKENELVVYLRCPILLIGCNNKIMEAVEKYLGCKIEIVEIDLID